MAPQDRRAQTRGRAYQVEDESRRLSRRTAPSLTTPAEDSRSAENPILFSHHSYFCSLPAGGDVGDRKEDPTKEAEGENQDQTTGNSGETAKPVKGLAISQPTSKYSTRIVIEKYDTVHSGGRQ